jgi:hypothetical protein
MGNPATHREPNLRPVEPRLVLDAWPDDGLSVELVQRAEALVNEEWKSLTEAVLHAHLLIEQALTQRVRQKFAHPEVLEDRRLARLGFSQLLTVYAGLYGPEPEDLQRLRSFNQLRNRIAHTMGEPDTLIAETLRALAPGEPKSPVALLGSSFFYLFFGELLGVRGAHWHDPDAQMPEERPLVLADGEQVCRTCHKR